MRFAEPLALLALILVPLSFFVFWLLEIQRQRIISRAGDRVLFEDLLELGADRAQKRRLLGSGLFAFAFALVAVALARPQFGMRTEERVARSMDLVIAIDLSRSMLARDVVPSRLVRAKMELSALIRELAGERIGLVGFTSMALPLCPLTTDHPALLLQLESAIPDDLPQGGTAIAEAIENGVRLLESSGGKGAGRAILVLTDGEEHVGDPVAAAKAAKEKGIEVHLVGVGSRTGEPIPLLDDKGNVTGYVKDNKGQTVITRLSETLIKDVASAGGGLFSVPGETGGLDLSALTSHFLRLKKAERASQTVRVYEERYRVALLPAFLMLLLATFLRTNRRKNRSTSGSGRKLWSLLLPVLLGAGPLLSEDKDVAEGNRALSEGRAKDAVAAYQSAEARLPKDPALAFNLGLAQAAAGELDQAMQHYRTALASADDPSLRAQAAFALGNAERGLSRFDEALKSYRQALLEEPSHTGARRNLELTRAIQRIQALQPKPPPDPNNKNEGDQKQDPPSQDGGTDDGGDDAGPDSGASDGESKGDGSAPGSEPDASGGQDAGTNQPNPADAGGEAPDSEGASSAESEAQKPEEKKLEQKEADRILDALQQREQTLKRTKLLTKTKARKVEKDW